MCSKSVTCEGNDIKDEKKKVYYNWSNNINYNSRANNILFTRSSDDIFNNSKQENVANVSNNFEENVITEEEIKEVENIRMK